MAERVTLDADRPEIVPADAPALVQRMNSEMRRGFQAKRIDSPSGSEVWRVSWVSNKIAGGRSGGYSRAVETVRWMAWADGQYLGGADTKASALADVAWFQGREG
jgi:hypothetical protein